MANLNPRAAFFYRDFRYYVGARFLGIGAHSMLAVVVGQYVYELTHSPLHLGYIGLAFFIPKILFTLWAGHAADRYDRWKIVLTCRLAQTLAVSGIALFAMTGSGNLWILYTLLFLTGLAYTFDGPASHALLPALVKSEHFSNAVTWNSWAFQLAVVSGPALAGWLYAFSGRALEAFCLTALARAGSLVLIALMKIRTGRMNKQEFSWDSMLAGIRYIFKERVILGIISLDLFAVLLGGAVALLPIYANEILHVGPKGLGILRAAPALGASLVAIALAYLPPLQQAGKTMLACVIIFGLSTLVFGVSTHFYLSLTALVILGASDMVSVIIRGVLVQVKTPPEMRGRVSAVNLIFIGASNELGEFESGVTANWFGVVPSVIIGGLGTLAVVGIWAGLFPEIRKYAKLN